MVKPTGPTNPRLRKLIAELEKKYRKTKVPLFKDLAERLYRPKRKSRKGVNLTKLNKYVNEGEIAIVPDKVLGYGYVNKKIGVVALSYSKTAKQKLNESKIKIIDFEEFIANAKRPFKVRIIE